MYETKVKNGEVVIDGVPFSQRSSKEWGKWKDNTDRLLEQCNRIVSKIGIVYRNWQIKLQGI